MTKHAVKIIELLKKYNGLDDDEISNKLSISPRQRVNIVCRKLEGEGKIIRIKENGEKIKNCLVSNKYKNNKVQKQSEISQSHMKKSVGVCLKDKMSEETVGNLNNGKCKKDDNYDILQDNIFEEAIRSFSKKIEFGLIEIYNEFSLQHELGIHLRAYLPSRKIQFERNISFFGLTKKDYIKREIDITIFKDTDTQPEMAIELKYPRNGQVPEQMFSFCKDIVFTEQLKRSGFCSAYVLIFADDPLFYQGSQNGIYSYFRGGKNLSGIIEKPTGTKDIELNIRGSYKVSWETVMKSLKLTLIKIQ